MKFLTQLSFILLIFFISSFAENPGFKSSVEKESPLASYSSDWNDPKYKKCNTAANANYMTADEKEVIYVLNLARINPSLFASTVIKKYPVSKTSYYNSLLATMTKLKPLPSLLPDSLCFAGALCHAIQSGKDGYVGHTRKNEECKKKWYYNGECCDYGHKDAVGIVMALLIDEGVTSLGHREICLGDYKKVGVSIQPHKTYWYNTVIDFHY